MARRTFQVQSIPMDDGSFEVDRETVSAVLTDLLGSVFRLGGIVSVAAHREQVTDDAYETTVVFITHDSHSPAVKLSDPVPDGD